MAFSGDDIEYGANGSSQPLLRPGVGPSEADEGGGVHTLLGVAHSGRIVRASTTLSRRSRSRGQVLGSIVCEEEGGPSGAPPPSLGWLSVSMLMICDVVGLGLLTLASTTATLGWAIGLTSLILFCPFNGYCGWLLWKAREVFPAGISQPQMALITYGKGLKRLIDIILDLTLFFIIAIYALFLSSTLSWLLYDVGLCQMEWSGAAIALLLLPCQISELKESKVLVFLNTGSIVVALGIILGVIISNGRADPGPEVVSSLLDGWSFFSAFSTMAFAYGGQIIYLEFIAEMSKPSDFSRSLVLSCSFELVVYLLVAVIGYYYVGRRVSPELVTAMPCNGWLRAASALLVIHLVISVVVKHLILCQRILLHLRPSKEQLEEGGVEGARNEGWGFRLRWFLVTAVLLACYYLVINAIPFFGDLVSLVGAIGVGTTAYIFPPLFYVAAQKHLAKRGRETAFSISSGGASGRLRYSSEPPSSMSSGSPSSGVSAGHMVLLVATFVFGLVIVIGGASASVYNIVNKFSDNPSPFSCGGNHSLAHICPN